MRGAMIPRLLACAIALVACGCGEPPMRGSGAAVPQAAAPPPELAAPSPGESPSDVMAMMDEVIQPVERGKPLVRFIAIPGCPACAKIDGVIAEHKAKNPALKTDRYSSISFAGRKYAKDQRIGSHGVVVYDRE